MAFITNVGILNSTNDAYDRITGTSSNDTVAYTTATAGVTVSLAIVGAQATGGSGFDELIGIENILGSNFGDILQGNASNNIINGNGGIDTVSYANATGGVKVDLSTSLIQNTISAGNDTLINIENLIGSGFDDLLIGSSVANAISGGGGNDIIYGSNGNDLLDGGAGAHDTVNYSKLGPVKLGAQGSVSKGSLGVDQLVGVEKIVGFSLGGDVIDLSPAGTAATGGAVVNLASSASPNVSFSVLNGTATLALQFTVSQFEDVIGTAFNDSIIGNTSNNNIRGGSGKDTLTGFGGVNSIDTFQLTSFADSLAANFDVVTDYQAGDRLDRPGVFNTVLTSASLFTSFTAIPSTFAANTSLAFKLTTGPLGTYVAFNDNTAGFNAALDSIVFLQGYNISSSNTVTIV